MEVQNQSQSAQATDSNKKTKGYMEPVKAHNTNEKAFINSFALVRTFQKKLNRETSLKAKQDFLKQKHFLNVMQCNEKEELHKSQDKEHFYRQANIDGRIVRKDPAADPLNQKKFGVKPLWTQLDPSLRYLLVEPCHLQNQQVTFDERVTRVFSKLQTQAIRHKNDFKNTNYDLDQKITRFMNEREVRMEYEAAQKRNDELKIPVILSADIESEDSEKKRERNLRAQEESQERLQQIFEQYPPVKNAKYDDDCMDLCVPGSETYSKNAYDEIMQDSGKRDQIASILIRYNNYDPKIMKDLVFCLDKIDPLDFKKFRDGRIELRSLRNKVLGIPDDFIVNMDDINAKCAAAEKRLQMSQNERRKTKHVHQMKKQESNKSMQEQSVKDKTLATGTRAASGTDLKKMQPVIKEVSTFGTAVSDSNLNSNFNAMVKFRINNHSVPTTQQPANMQNTVLKLQQQQQQQSGTGSQQALPTAPPHLLHKTSKTVKQSSLKPPRVDLSSGQISPRRLSIHGGTRTSSHVSLNLASSAFQDPDNAAKMQFYRRMEELTAAKFITEEADAADQSSRAPTGKSSAIGQNHHYSYQQDNNKGQGNVTVRSKEKEKRTKAINHQTSAKSLNSEKETPNKFNSPRGSHQIRAGYLNPEMQAKLKERIFLRESQKKERELAQKQHKLQQKAQDEFFKRLRGVDVYNLVGERIKNANKRKRNTSSSSDTISETQSQKEAYGVGTSVVTLAQLTKKKPRPREIIHGLTDKKARKLARRQQEEMLASDTDLQTKNDDRSIGLTTFNDLGENSELRMPQTQSLVNLEDQSVDSSREPKKSTIADFQRLDKAVAKKEYKTINVDSNTSSREEKLKSKFVSRPLSTTRVQGATLESDRADGEKHNKKVKLQQPPVTADSNEEVEVTEDDMLGREFHKMSGKLLDLVTQQSQQVEVKPVNQSDQRLMRSVLEASRRTRQAKIYKTGSEANKTDQAIEGMFQTLDADDSSKANQLTNSITLSTSQNQKLSAVQQQLGVIYSKAPHTQVQSINNVNSIIQETYGAMEDQIVTSSQQDQFNCSNKAFPRRSSGSRFGMRPQSSNSAKKPYSSVKSPTGVQANIYTETKMRSTCGGTGFYHQNSLGSHVVRREGNSQLVSNADITSTKQSSIAKYKATKLSQRSEVEHMYTSLQSHGSVPRSQEDQSPDATVTRQQNSTNQVKVSDRFISFVDSLGIPINQNGGKSTIKQLAANQQRRKQQLLFQTEQAFQSQASPPGETTWMRSEQKIIKKDSMSGRRRRQKVLAHQLSQKNIASHPMTNQYYQTQQEPEPEYIVVARSHGSKQWKAIKASEQPMSPSLNSQSQLRQHWPAKDDKKNDSTIILSGESSMLFLVDSQKQQQEIKSSPLRKSLYKAQKSANQLTQLQQQKNPDLARDFSGQVDQRRASQKNSVSKPTQAQKSKPKQAYRNHHQIVSPLDERQATNTASFHTLEESPKTKHSSSIEPAKQQALQRKVPTHVPKNSQEIGQELPLKITSVNIQAASRGQKAAAYHLMNTASHASKFSFSQQMLTDVKKKNYEANYGMSGGDDVVIKKSSGLTFGQSTDKQSGPTSGYATSQKLTKMQKSEAEGSVPSLKTPSLNMIMEANGQSQQQQPHKDEGVVERFSVLQKTPTTVVALQESQEYQEPKSASTLVINQHTTFQSGAKSKQTASHYYMTDAQKQRLVSTYGHKKHQDYRRSFDRLPHNLKQVSAAQANSSTVQKKSVGNFRDRVVQEISGMRQRLSQRSALKSDKGLSSPQTAMKTPEQIALQEAKNGDLLRSVPFMQSPSAADGSPQDGSSKDLARQSRQSCEGEMKPSEKLRGLIASQEMDSEGPAQPPANNSAVIVSEDQKSM